MCRRLVDDIVLQLGTGGDGSALNGAVVPIDLPFAEGDELELQILNSTTDGDVQLYKGHANTAQPQRLQLRVGALASENPGVPVTTKVRSPQYTLICSNASGLVTVIVRLYQGGACRS